MIEKCSLYTLDEMKELILSNTSKHTLGKINGELGSDILLSIINYLGDSQTPTTPNIRQYTLFVSQPFPDNNWTPIVQTLGTLTDDTKYTILFIEVVGTSYILNSELANVVASLKQDMALEEYYWSGYNEVGTGSSIAYIGMSGANLVLTANKPSMSSQAAAWGFRITELVGDGNFVPTSSLLITL